MKTASTLQLFVLSTALLSIQSFAASATMDTHIVHHFSDLVDQGKYEQAAQDCLSDNVNFSSPKFNYKSKEEWLAKFPTFHKKNAKGPGPAFGLPELVHDKVYVRHGKVKVMGFDISIKEEIELDEEGKILKSAMKKA